MINWIPARSADLSEVELEIRRQTTEVERIVGGLSGEALNWRPSPAKWSVGGHVAHMAIVNGPYIETITRCLAKARERGWMGDGPYRHGWFGPWFAGAMAPPPRKRWKTAPGMVPDPEVEGVDLLQFFRDCHGELARVAEEARGVDLGRARLSSAFMRILRFSAGSTFGVMLSHNRRHLWLIDELMADPAFPS
jgi:hypothetical protein